ncbi:hypothetical protein [Streptomyces sp. NPDC048442]|uniref:hypothetical protein n=1 Tax=Streptomyces sp. NPDC048442 TaxID=3154823 RepID=UPI00343B40E5
MPPVPAAGSPAFNEAWFDAMDLITALGTVDATAEQLLAPARAALDALYDHVEQAERR